MVSGFKGTQAASLTNHAALTAADEVNQSGNIDILCQLRLGQFFGELSEINLLTEKELLVGTLECAPRCFVKTSSL